MTVTEQEKKVEKNWPGFFLGLDLAVLILSIVIPFVLIYINQATNGCGQHMFSDSGNGAYGWMWGRSLGFTCLIWFIYAMLKGFRTKKIAKAIHNMKTAKNIHCRTALISILILSLHIIVLVSSDPWKSIILYQRVQHFPYIYYALKLWTGIVFGAIMVISSALFVYLRDMNRLKTFGYKRFIWVHRIMLICAILLVIHVLFINTEVWLATIAGHIADD